VTAINRDNITLNNERVIKCSEPLHLDQGTALLRLTFFEYRQLFFFAKAAWSARTTLFREVLDGLTSHPVLLRFYYSIA
jgi:hypothetical protein